MLLIAISFYVIYEVIYNIYLWATKQDLRSPIGSLIGLVCFLLLAFPIMKCFFVKYYNNNSFWLVLILLGSIVNVYLTYLDRDFYRYNNNNLKEEEEEEDIYDFKYNAGIRDATILFTVVGIIPCHYKWILLIIC